MLRQKATGEETVVTLVPIQGDFLVDMDSNIPNNYISHEYALIFSINDNFIKGGPVSGAKTLVTQVPTFVSSARPVNHPSRSNITRQHSLCPNAVVYDALTLSNAKKARSTRYK